MRGIIFTEPNFHLTVDEIKTETRRIMKNQPDARGLRTTNVPFEDWHGKEYKPYYKVGERLYLKEPYASYGIGHIIYKYSPEGKANDFQFQWQNPRYMPESAARHFIEITGVRAERVQDISEEDCLKEGIKVGKCGNESNWMKAFYCPGDNQPYITAKDAYEVEFNMINGKGSWEKNPWIWVYEYKLVK